MIYQLEQAMYQLSELFMAPVLILIAALFIYSLFATGQYIMQTIQRKQNQQQFYNLLNSELGENKALNLVGYPLSQLANNHPRVSKDQLDVNALTQLEGVRNVSRLAPMLGLIATMVPMGPALKGLADGNIQGISENLIVAFSAVIFGLVIASITFWIACVKKRWLAEELVALTPLLQESKLQALQMMNSSESTNTKNKVEASIQGASNAAA
ncbi:MotA/TolQ/ExbB proton channel family protein [Colwellia echini]|uniref:MotA/TolQ/ExbB proton channel domain-containing protein n=1 Tax=Colwellia echini TaxID=1982103 RepID=A0ABY3MUW8_9GAMM|nr:MotA/TolQ/ExbB proton channel family protein [Colwellia echini]TYK65001.1 hypothetical protein CWS31_012815 [Colwellia echini]